MKTCFFQLGRVALLSAILLCPLFATAQRIIDKDLPEFDRIEFVGRGEITLIQDNNPHVRMEASDEDDLRHFETEVRGRALRILYNHNDGDWIDIAPKIRVTIMYPTLSRLEITGLARVSSADRINTDRFRLEVEGMGNVELNLAVASLDVVSAGTATINLSGNADEISIVNDGTGTIDAFDLISQDADVEVNGIGLVRVNSHQRLRAEANGFGASIKYRGEPKDTFFNTSGFASIKADN